MRPGLAIAIAALLVVGACRQAPDQVRSQLLGTHVWRADPDWFGGLSAVQITDGGTALWALSDKGRLLRAALTRDGDQITGAQITGQWRLKNSSGQVLAPGTTDSEGLALGADGTLFVSFEGAHRVAAYASPTSRAQVLTQLAQFDGLELNKSLEALAIDAQGRLYAVPEINDGPIPVYRRDGAGWTVAFALPPSRGFLPVGADIGPDGRLYLLERGFSPLGFRTQLRRFDLSDQGATDQVTLIRTAFGTHDNLEGVSIWRDDQGALRATLIADDNFLSLQQTQLVEYRLPDPVELQREPR